jgi:hypothetical protein
MKAMKKLIVALGATALLAAATLVTTAAPASAKERAEIKVKPNTTVTISDIPGPLPLGNLYPLFGSGPTDCATGNANIYCDTFPVTLDIPDIKKGFYSLNIKLSWNTTNYVIPGNGTVPAPTQLGLGVWDNPIVKDDDAPKTCDPDSSDVDYYTCLILGPAGGDPGGDESYVDTWLQNEQPILFGLVPHHTKYSIVVVNYYGLPTPYTLSVSLVAPTAADLLDKSAPSPADLSNLIPAGATGGGAALPSIGGGQLAPTGPSTAEVLAGLGVNAANPDTDFAGLGLNNENLELNASDIIAGRAIRSIRRPGNENGLLLWFWLVALPAATLAGAVVWFVRRRKSLLAT